MKWKIKFHVLLDCFHVDRAFEGPVRWPIEYLLLEMRKLFLHLPETEELDRLVKLL